MSNEAQAVITVEQHESELAGLREIHARDLAARDEEITRINGELETVKATPEHAQYLQRKATEARIAEHLPKAKAARNSDGSHPDGLTVRIVATGETANYSKDQAIALIASGAAEFVGVFADHGAGITTASSHSAVAKAVASAR